MPTLYDTLSPWWSGGLAYAYGLTADPGFALYTCKDGNKCQDPFYNDGGPPTDKV